MELELRQKASKERRERDAVTDEIIETLFLPLQYQNPQEKGDGGSTEGDANEQSSEESDEIALKVIDARVVADRLRQGKFSRPQIMAVVDRLYEHHHGKTEELDRTLVQMEAITQMEEQEKLQHKMARYRVYFKVLTQAAVLLDESIVANSVLEDAPKSASSPTTQTRIPRDTRPSASSVTSSSRPKIKSPSTISQSTLFVTSGHLTKSIHTRIGELRQRHQVELNRNRAVEANRMAEMSAKSSASPGGRGMHYPGIRNTNGTVMASAIWSSSTGETPSFIPLWIPSPYIPYILSLDKEARSLEDNTTDYKSIADSTNSTVATSSSSAPVAAPFAVISNSSLEAAEVEKLKNEVLMGSRFYVTSYEFAPGAALFRGNVRTSLGSVPVPLSSQKGNNRTSWFARQYQHVTSTPFDNNTAMVFADIQKRLKKAGLDRKVQLFVLPDPETVFAGQSATTRGSPATTSAMGMRRPGIDASTETSVMDGAKPVVLALPKALTPDESKLKRGWFRKFGKALCYPFAALVTFTYSFFAYALNPTFFDALVHQRDLTVLKHCLPLAVGVLAVQVIHEAAHYLVARRKKIAIGLPVPIPSLIVDLPFFGWITPLRSFPSSRAALVDFALSGPMAALAVSLGLVFAGIGLTSRATALDIVRYPFLSVASLKSSSILSWLLPKTMMLPLAQPIPMHPLFVVGCSGLVSSALNLLPIFRLDGGRACFAAMGQRSGAIISAGTVLWIVGNFFSGKGSSLLMYWTVLVALFQSRVEIPCRDECTEVGVKRQWLWLTSFLLSISILVPFPKSGTGI